MSKRSRPTKTRLRKTSSYLDNKKRSESDESRDEQINAVLQGQKAIDNWNTDLIGTTGWKSEVNLIDHFNNIQLENGIIIQMYMENPIKQIGHDENGKVVHLEWGIRQIDKRVQNTDKNNWGPTPFPVIDKGIIMAISPAVLIWYYEQKEKLAKFDKKAADAYMIPQVGDIVYTKLFMFKDTRYYVNKQEKCEDFVMNQNEIRLKHFQNLFLIDNYTIESIVRPGKETEMADTHVPIDDRYQIMTSPVDPVNSVDSNDEVIEDIEEKES